MSRIVTCGDLDRKRERERERERREISKFCHWLFKGFALSSTNEDSAVGRAYSDLAADWATEEKCFNCRQKQEDLFTPSTSRPAFGPTK